MSMNRREELELNYCQITGFFREGCWYRFRKIQYLREE
jgi:hypothetical protein